MPTVTLTIICETPSVEDISGSAAAAGLRVKWLSSTKLCIYAHVFEDIETWAAPYEGVEGITTVYNRIAPPSSYIEEYTIIESTDSTALDVSGYTVPPSTFKPFYTPSTSYPPNAYFRSQRYMTASDLASIYKFPTPNPLKPVVVGIVSYHGHLYGTADANGRLLTGDPYTYWTSIGIPTNLHPMVLLVNTNGSPVSISPTPPASFDGEFLESTLDVCMVGGACPSPNLTIILYNAVNEPSTASYYNKIFNVPVIYNGKSYLPSIVSISYGGYEQFLLSDGTLQTNYDTISADLVFQAASARGVNICAATGDSGSQVHWHQPGYNVPWPASSAYAIAVGGTQLWCPNYTYDSATYEFVWNKGQGHITGGGYSSIFPKPSYQNAIPGTMRAIPDISLMAEAKIIITYSGSPGSSLAVTGGTSASAPLFAGFLASICPTTFVNPILYTADSRCFHDITYGDNKSGGNPGYFAGPGYDVTTGLGSIAGNYLASVIAPNPIVNIGCELQ